MSPSRSVAVALAVLLPLAASAQARLTPRAHKMATEVMGLKNEFRQDSQKLRPTFTAWQQVADRIAAVDPRARPGEALALCVRAGSVGDQVLSLVRQMAETAERAVLLVERIDNLAQLENARQVADLGDVTRSWLTGVQGARDEFVANHAQVQARCGELRSAILKKPAEAKAPASGAAAPQPEAEAPQEAASAGE